VEEERDRDQRCNIILLYNTSDDEFGQWRQFTVTVSNSTGQCDQHRSHAHGQRRCGGAFDHTQPASQTVTAGQAAAFTVAANGHAAADVSVEEERDRDQRCNIIL